MNKIGIMQGRVIPESLDKFQIFPISNWEEEILKIKKIGFEYMELLYDKDLVCRRLLSNPADLNKLGIDSDSDNKKPAAHSMCVDYLASISVIDSGRRFCNALTDIIEIVKNTTIKILVIPFFDKNLLGSQEEFEAALGYLEEGNLDEIAFANNILLALEPTLPASKTRAILEKYGFKNIKICCDLGNVRAMGYYPENEIIELGDFICHVHIKDRKINGPNMIPGKGDVDFKACFKSLKKIEYKELMILETKYYNTPVDDAIENLRFVKNTFMEI